MKINFKLIALLLVLTLLNCKNKNTSLEFKYADRPIVLNCENINSKLYNEALYSFEDDILNFYLKTKPNTSLIFAYNQFIREAIYGRYNYEKMVSDHSLKIFEALKKESELWDTKNTKSHLNYNSPFFSCIADNITDKNLKTTLNALISTNSMSPKLFVAPLVTNYRSALTDKNLAAYIAFDLYYAHLFDINLSEVNFNKPESKVDFNKIPQLPKESPQKTINN